MILKNISKFVIIFLCTVIISSVNFNTSFADNHNPKTIKINELKKEITDLGGTPLKREGLLSSLSKWIDQLEAQLEKLKKIEILKSELKKELEALGEKIESDEKKELEADEQIIALRKQIDDAKAKKKAAEEKKKRDAKIAVAVEMLKDELAALGEDPVIDTSDIDSDEQIKALKKQIKDIKEKIKTEKAEAEKKAKAEKAKADKKAKAEKAEADKKAKAEEKKQIRLKAIEDIKKEILLMGEAPMSEYEFTTEDQYIKALRKQVEEIKKLKEQEELAKKNEIPQWWIDAENNSSESIIYVGGTADSSDIQAAKEIAEFNAKINLASQIESIINIKTDQMFKQVGIDNDEVLKREFNRISKDVSKNVSVKGYRVFKRDQLNIGNSKWRAFVVLEFKTGLAYKTFINEVDTRQSVKADIKKLKNTEAFKELEQYVAEFSGA